MHVDCGATDELFITKLTSVAKPDTLEQETRNSRDESVKIQECRSNAMSTKPDPTSYSTHACYYPSL